MQCFLFGGPEWTRNTWCQPICCWDIKASWKESWQFAICTVPVSNHSVRAVHKRSCRCSRTLLYEHSHDSISKFGNANHHLHHFLLLGCWQWSICVAVCSWVRHRTHKSWFWCFHLFRMVAIGRIHLLVVRQWRIICPPANHFYNEFSVAACTFSMCDRWKTCATLVFYKQDEYWIIVRKSNAPSALTIVWARH